MIRDRRIHLDKVEKITLEFFSRIQTSGWLCFADKAIKANNIIVAECYAKGLETNFR